VDFRIADTFTGAFARLPVVDQAVGSVLAIEFEV
jgi:hypothetical protein